MSKEETYCIFDGTFFGVGEAENPDGAMQIIEMMNPSAELMSSGFGITNYELEIIFRNFIVCKNPILTFYYLDETDGTTLIDLVSEDIDFMDFIGDKRFDHLNN